MAGVAWLAFSATLASCDGAVWRPLRLILRARRCRRDEFTALPRSCRAAAHPVMEEAISGRSFPDTAGLISAFRPSGLRNKLVMLSGRAGDVGQVEAAAGPPGLLVTGGAQTAGGLLQDPGGFRAGGPAHRPPPVLLAGGGQEPDGGDVVTATGVQGAVQFDELGAVTGAERQVVLHAALGP